MAVCTWGFGKYGQLGTGQTSSSETPQVVKLPRGSTPRQISCGAHFTTILCATAARSGSLGKIYSCGWGKYGRLGVGSEDDQPIPAEVALTPSADILEVSAGHWHVCCVTSDGGLFSWGYNKTHGVLGLSGGDPSSSALEVVPLRIPLPIGLVKFKTVSCGYNFTYAVTVEGRCWSWGSGARGVLGHGDDKDRCQPTPVEALNEASISRLGCGYSHAALVDSSGVLYTVGNGEDGALGHGKADKSDKVIPTSVQALKGVIITSASCSHGEHHGHTLACTGAGEVYSWGDGYKGKLGHGNQESRELPAKIDHSSFLGQAVIQVSCGGIHSAAVTQEGCVFTWGCGSDGRLGHPEAKGHRYLFRSDVPRKVEGLPRNMKALAVSCSYYHTAVLCT